VSGDDFEELWKVTDSKVATQSAAATSLEALLEKQTEEILCLSDELKIIRQENMRLREEMSKLHSKADICERVLGDYTSLLDLNRCLTKKLNEFMRLREKDASQLRAMKNLLLD